MDPCGFCCKREMSISLICSKYNSWIHTRRAKIPEGSAKLGKDFMCKSSTDSSAQSVGSLCDGIETVHSFLYLGNKVDQYKKNFAQNCDLK